VFLFSVENNTEKQKKRPLALIIEN